MQEASNLSLAEQAYTALKQDILTCVLDPGSQVAQSRLIERYHLGATPIREALKRLEQEGYVSSIPRLGYTIRSITVADVYDLYELRILLELHAVQLVVMRASNQQLSNIEQKAGFTYRFKDFDSYQDFLARNADFHTTIALASGNRKLASAIQQVLDEMGRIFHLGLEVRDSAEEMRNEHLALAQALSERNAALAQQILKDQITRSQQRVLEMLNERMKDRSINELPIHL